MQIFVLAAEAGNNEMDDDEDPDVYTVYKAGRACLQALKELVRFCYLGSDGSQSNKRF